MATTIKSTDILTHNRDRSFICRGTFGRVYYCFYQGEVKAVKLLRFLGSKETIENNKKEVEKEVEILKTMKDSKNIVKYHGTVNFNCEGWVGIAMEYLPRGILSDFLSEKSKFRSICIKLRLRILYDVAKGLYDLHNAKFDCRIAHNDLKPDNVLLDAHFRAKLCDFGGSDFIASTSASIKTQGASPSKIHTTCYAAPEFLLNLGCSRTREMDVFSFAIVIYFTLENKHPFRNFDDSDIVRHYGKKESGPPKLGSQFPYDTVKTQNLKIFEKLRDIMEKCGAIDAGDRITMEEVKKDLKIYYSKHKEEIEKRFLQHINGNPLKEIKQDQSCINLEQLCRRLDGASGGDIKEKEESSEKTPHQDEFFRKIRTEDSCDELDKDSKFSLESPNGVFKCVVVEKN